jgi:hypothetical protein
MSRQYLTHPSGGLVYHWRAARDRNGLWRPFRDQIATWLAEWQPTPRHLVLIGPSAGYTLNPGFLARFDRVSALEPDGLACILLRRRYPAIRFDFHPALGQPEALLRQFPGAAYLFCNLLGQAWTSTAAEQWRPALEAALAGRSWASYHDIVSTTRPPDRTDAIDLAALGDPDDLLERFWVRGELSVDDHGTYGLFPDLPRRYALWQIGPGRFHLIEWLQG